MRIFTKMREHKVLCCFICLLLILVLAAVVLFGINRFTMMVEPSGAVEVTLEYGSDYADPGATALVRGTLFCKNGFFADAAVQTDGTVDTGKIGTYTISYRAEFLGLTSTAQRVVHVVDTTAPVIRLDGEKEISLYVGDAYTEPGYTAWDDCDGELTQAIEVVLEEDIITYTVTDKAGNTATTQRTIVWNLPETPRILLEGGAVFNMNAGEKYVEPGFTVACAGEQDLASSVTVSGKVNIYVPGSYELTYEVTDGKGNTASVVRTVVVSAVPQPEIVVPEGKVIYLTFDDGPSDYTTELLEVLAKYDVKATFFVIHSENFQIIKDIVAGGHAIGIHSCTHKYESIYASEEAYFNDVLTMQQLIYDETGVMTTLVRFPGGSSNTASRFNKGIMTRLTQLLTDTGFQYYDWNVDSGDASFSHSPEDVYYNIIHGASKHDYSIVLQHDTHYFSVMAVEKVIRWGLDNGYTFLPLDPSSPYVHSRLRN